MTGGRYVPTIDPTYWAVIEHFVTSAVEDARGRTAYSDQELDLAISRLALWSWQTAGMELDRNILLSRDVIARFASVGCPQLSPAARGNVRSQLLRVSEALLDQNHVLRRLEPLAPAEPTAPYTSDELVSLRSWAESQATLARRANACVLLALGVGAGLSATEIGALRVGNIKVDDGGVLVCVSDARGRPRVVPVLVEWEGALVDRVAALGSQRFVFRENHTSYYPNLISNFVAHSRFVGVRPQTQRMRSTWIVHHLDAGTPVVLLMRAAGVESLEALTRYVRFVDDMKEREARDRLRWA